MKGWRYCEFYDAPYKTETGRFLEMQCEEGCEKCAVMPEIHPSDCECKNKKPPLTDCHAGA